MTSFLKLTPEIAERIYHRYPKPGSFSAQLFRLANKPMTDQRIRLKITGDLGTITGQTNGWYHIDFDGGVRPFTCNYYGDWEFELV